MKNLLLITAMLFTVFNTKLYSQDSEPSPLRFNYIVNGVSVNNQFLSKDSFPQTKFMIGSQWGAHARMSQALNFNVNHAWQPRIGWDSSGIIHNNADAGYKLNYIWDGREYRDCRAFQFKPTLYIPESKRGQLVVQSADTTKSIFGFSYIRDTNQLLNNPTRTRYHLYKDSTNYIDSVVLGKVWLDDRYEFFSDLADSVFNPINGKHWIFSINLRRLNPSELGSTNEPILSIRLPYKMKVNDTTFAYDTIRFSTKPRYSLNDTVRLKYREDRGFALNDTATNQNYFVITNKMLPDNTFISNTGRQDITINAVFICDPNLTPFNPFVKNSTYPYINNLDVQIKYHGKWDVAINYCRISTPYGYDYLVGKFDNQIQAVYQAHIDSIQNGGYEIFGFYGRDEFEEEYFLEQRYRTRLLNYTTVSEGAGGHYYDHYRHHVEPMYLWNGAGNMKPDQSAPFINRNKGSEPNLKRMNYPIYGYKGQLNDPMVSTYETDLDFNNTSYTNYSINNWKIFRSENIDTIFFWHDWNGPHDTIRGMDWYLYQMYWSRSTQGFIERTTYNKYYHNPDYLYSENLWWENNYPVGNWGISDNSPYVNTARPQTGEEVRWLMWVNLCMGSKGFLYDARCDSLRTSSDNDTGGFLYNQHQLNTYDTWDLDSLIFTDNSRIGGDFIPEIDSSMFIHKFINRDSVSHYLGVPIDRMYYGRKSPRIEMYNIHNWIRANDALLMDLRLVSAFSKGFRVWRHADTARFVDTIMNKYFNLDDRMIIFDPSDNNKTLVSDIGIKTRPIDRELNGQPYYEPYDSSFFDITMLRFKDDEDLSSGSFVIAALNRRTDPLFYANDMLISYDFPSMEPLNELSYEGMRFYSTAEMERFCDEGGNVINPTSLPDWNNQNIYVDDIDCFKPAEYWQDKYWKRQGSRELNIATKVIDGSKNIYYRVEEITDGTEFDEDLQWWKQEEIRNRIDRIIPQGESLSIKLLPGQGKMFKVTFIETPNLFGELAFSNQTKIIAYPVNQTSNYDFEKVNDTLNFYKDDSMYYHIVYDRKQPTDMSRVYYRRSAIPYDRTVNTKIIQWGPEILLSDTIVFTKALHLPQLPVDSIFRVAGSSLSCKNPSIVVRYDEVNSIAKAYIVFGCSMPDLGSHPDFPKVFIVESVVRHNQLFPTLKGPNRLKPIVVSTVNSTNPDQLDVWAAPNINASFSGNYYTWSDSLGGIGVGFKTPNDNGFITNKKFIKYHPSGKCNQPSLNTYSRLNINEDNCALVFKEISENWTNIIYTQLHNPNGQIDNYVPLNYCDMNNILHRMGIYSFDMKSMMINYNITGQTYANPSYPAVYRPVEFARRPGFEVADSLHYVGAIWDRVYWQTTLDTDPLSPMGISMKNIDIDLTQDCWYLLPALRLYNPTYNLAQPSPGPGAPSSNKSGTFGQFALSDSSFLLNFIKYPYLGSPNVYSDVYQINMNGWLNYFARWTGPFEDWSVDLQWWASVGQGMYPHTTHTPVITENRDWYIHNRIYQAENNAIRTSAILFLKGTQDQKTIYPLLSLSDENSKSQISEIFTLGNSIESRYTSIGLKAFSKDENGRIKRSDTIVSNWFRIDAIKELAFYSILSDTTLFSFELEDNNGKSLKLPMSTDRSSSLNSRKITFLNGKNKEYRIKLTKKSKDVSVWLDLLFDDKRDLSEEVSDYSSKELRKSNVEFEPKHQVYDLSDHEITSGEMINLKTYPNPAGDYIYVSCELLTNSDKNSDVHYTLYSSTGSKVYESTSKESITIIHTDNLPSGVYFLKAEQLEFDLNSDVKPFVTKTVIIQR